MVDHMPTMCEALGLKKKKVTAVITEYLPFAIHSLGILQLFLATTLCKIFTLVRKVILLIS